MSLAVLYSTFPSLEAAEPAARALVEERLVACVNLVPGVVSIYRWEGAVQRESEVVLIAKTTESRVEAAALRLQALHPYQTPCVTWGPWAGSLPAFARWVEGETDGARREDSTSIP